MYIKHLAQFSNNGDDDSLYKTTKFKVTSLSENTFTDWYLHNLRVSVHEVKSKGSVLKIGLECSCLHKTMQFIHQLYTTQKLLHHNRIGFKLIPYSGCALSHHHLGPHYLGESFPSSSIT